MGQPWPTGFPHIIRDINLACGWSVKPQSDVKESHFSAGGGITIYSLVSAKYTQDWEERGTPLGKVQDCNEKIPREDMAVEGGERRDSDSPAGKKRIDFFLPR